MAEKQDGFVRGESNAITDVQGVKVGHLTVSKDLPGPGGKKISVRTGLTAVLPYPMEKPLRLFCGSLNLRSTSEMTGYENLEDFCYLNSPVVITNSYNVGQVYNAVLSYGFALKRDETWPPLVIGINDSCLNETAGFSLDEKDIVEALFQAGTGKVQEGAVGVGLGLAAFDGKGGVGTASRQLIIGAQKFVCGVLAASNHGNTGFSEGSLTLVLAVDIPLVPHQIKRILQLVVPSLGPDHLQTNPSDSVSAVLFTTANAMSMVNEGPALFEYQAADDSWLAEIAQSCSEAALESIFSSLAKAKPVSGRLGRTFKPLSPDALAKLFKKQQD
jgi:L-aminopeptidase/D-esterase-like protein